MSRKPAAFAYPRRVAGRITVPVAADGVCERPSGRQTIRLKP